MPSNKGVGPKSHHAIHPKRIGAYYYWITLLCTFMLEASAIKPGRTGHLATFEQWPTTTEAILSWASWGFGEVLTYKSRTHFLTYEGGWKTTVWPQLKHKALPKMHLCSHVLGHFILVFECLNAAILLSIKQAGDKGFTIMPAKVLKKELKKRIDKTQKSMPFQPSLTIRQPRSMKDRQQAWVLAGLRHIRAPIVFWFLDIHLFPMMVGNVNLCCCFCFLQLWCE